MVFQTKLALQSSEDQWMTITAVSSSGPNLLLTCKSHHHYVAFIVSQIVDGMSSQAFLITSINDNHVLKSIRDICKSRCTLRTVK